MKKYVYFMICLANLGCHQSKQPVVPDAAARVAGVYDLTYTMAYWKEYVDLPGSLTLVRTGAQQVKPRFQLFIPDSLIGQGYWQLTEVNSDSIFYRGTGYFGTIKDGQLSVEGYADRVFAFRFKKR